MCVHDCVHGVRKGRTDVEGWTWYEGGGGSNLEPKFSMWLQSVIIGEIKLVLSVSLLSTHIFLRLQNVTNHQLGLEHIPENCNSPSYQTDMF